MTWQAVTRRLLVTQCRGLPVNQNDLWEDMEEAVQFVRQMIEQFNKSMIEVCSFNFKYPLNRVNCILRCSVDPVEEILYVESIYMP